MQPPIKKTVKVRIDETDIPLLDEQAQALGVTRSELIRQRAVSPSNGIKAFSTEEYHQLQRDAYHTTLGTLSRHHVESIVAFVFARMASR